MRLTNSADRYTREAFMRRDIVAAEVAIVSGTLQQQREAAAALRIWAAG
jgi:hypothetical protein